VKALKSNIIQKLALKSNIQEQSGLKSLIKRDEKVHTYSIVLYVAVEGAKLAVVLG
jgi:hypothetical protein